MNSEVGVFPEKEINGKPFHVFSLLPQTTDNSSSFSSHSLSGDPSLQTRFFCPDSRRAADRSLNQKEYRNHEEMVTFTTSPRFNKGTIDQLVQNDPYICKHPVLPLFWFNNETPDNGCRACLMPEAGSGCYYTCETCKKVYHKECVEAPLFIEHPSYPSLSLQLCTRSLSQSWSCIFCETRISAAFMSYHCSTYEVSIHLICALKPIPIIIDHSKRHPHPLTFFPKQASLACNICGMIKELIPTYICARCVFVVHRDCIYFPYVIRICRHHHRISFTYSLPSQGNLSCGVCRRKVDNSYGAYSCNECGYFVHSRCALRKDLWDGKELEGTTEEPEIVQDPFQTIADGIILHFSHKHHLKLEICRVYDEDKYCQACVLPIYDGNYYSCVDDDHCDFILHETCANAPRKIRHPLHAHSLTLQVVPGEYYADGLFRCSACARKCNGFAYEGHYMENDKFRLDLRCAFISEPFNYEGHDHPLFLALTPDEAKEAKCQICHHNRDDYRYEGLFLGMLNCIECDYVICFTCATLPYKAKYKHDKHFLTFRKRLGASGQSDWCEACEYEIVHSIKGGYYACDEYCCTTLHVNCLLGKDPYLKQGQTISQNGKELHILRNNTMSRPLCHSSDCEERCPNRVIFQLRHMTYCSYDCAEEYLC